MRGVLHAVNYLYNILQAIRFKCVDFPLKTYEPAAAFLIAQEHKFSTKAQ